MWTHQSIEGRKEEVLLMNTLGACIQKAFTEGYSESFKVTSRGLYAISKSRYYRPEQLLLIDTYRCDTQGEQAMMYAIETSDGVKGTLINTNAGFLDSNIEKFIAEADEIRRQYLRHNQHQC